MRKGDGARQALIRRAATLFDSRGYEAVSVKDIADSLGWAKSLFYYYCSGKEELVRLSAQARACDVMERIKPQLAAQTGGSVPKLALALSCAGFWAGGDALESAKRLHTLYMPGNLPWRTYLRAQIAPPLGKICNDIIEDGVKAYEMYTPYPANMGAAAVDLTIDLSEKLALMVMDGSEAALEDAHGALNAYRCAVERLMEAPFGSLRLVEFSFIRDVARAFAGDRAGEVKDSEKTVTCAGRTDTYAYDNNGAGRGAGDAPSDAS